MLVAQVFKSRYWLKNLWKNKKKVIHIWRNMLPENLLFLWNDIFHWVRVRETWEGLAGRTCLAPLSHWGRHRLLRELRVDVADITGTSLERSESWSNIVHWYKESSLGHFWITPTTFGMNGGLTFLASSLFQFMDAKKECSCSSTWTHTEVRPVVVGGGFMLNAVHLQGLDSPLSACRLASPAIPLTANGQPQTLCYEASGGH